MDELICRFLKARTTPAEEESIRAWRRISASNEAYYQQLVLLLGEAAEALVDGEVPPVPPTAALMRGRGGMDRPGQPLGSERRWWWRGGALVAAAAAAWIILLVHNPPPAGPEGFSLQAGEFVTGSAETATAILSDGTVVRLAPGSRLRIPGGAGARDVILEGRAYFAVTDMPGHPFHVRTRAGEARVLGTRFEVRVQDEEMRLIVLEGRVALNAGRGQVEVGAGEMSVVTDGSTSAPVRVHDLKPLVDWLQRFIVFQDTPLRQAARELEREYGVPVVVTDSLLARETITGWYADRTFEEVLMIVCTVMQASCSMENGTATIGPHGTGGT